MHTLVWLRNSSGTPSSKSLQEKEAKEVLYCLLSGPHFKSQLGQPIDIENEISKIPVFNVRSHGMLKDILKYYNSIIVIQSHL